MTATAYLFPGQGVQAARARRARARARARPARHRARPARRGSVRALRREHALRAARDRAREPRRVAPRSTRATPPRSPGIRSASCRRSPRPARSPRPTPCASRSLRGELMAQAAERRPAERCSPCSAARPSRRCELADDHALVVANDNAPGQLVLAGPQDGVDAARRAARGRGLRAIELDVTGAFHSPQMQPARDALAAALAEITWARAAASRLQRPHGRPFTDPVQELAAAVVAPVRWRELLLALRDAGAQRFVDVGPGDVLARLVDRNLQGAAEMASLSQPDLVVVEPALRVGAAACGLGAALPERVVGNDEATSRLGRRRRVGRAPHRHPRAPLGRSRRPPARARRRRRAPRARRRGRRGDRPRPRPRRDGHRRRGHARVRTAGRRRARRASAPARSTSAPRAPGFVSALGLGAAMIEAGRVARVLVIGAEILSRHLDPGDRQTTRDLRRRRRRRRARGGRRRAHRPRDPRRGRRARRPDHGAARHRLHPDGRPRRLRRGRAPDVGGVARRPAPPPTSSSPTSTCSSSTRPTRASSAR